MGISSISSLKQLLPLQQTNGAAPVQDGTSMFGDIYDNLIGNANSTNEAFEGDIVKAAEGELDNPHQLVIDSAKANISLTLLSSVRNSALEAYNDIIKMGM